MGTVKQKEIERPLPYHAEAEQCVLGTIILKNNRLDDAREILTAEKFFMGSNRIIFSRMIEMSDERVSIDLLTLCDRLRNENELEAVGGVAYVASLIDGIPSTANVMDYAHSVLYCYTRRRIIYLAQAMTEQSFSGGSSQKILEDFTASLSDLSSEVDSSNDGLSERDAAIRMLAALDKQEGARAFSGIVELDNWTGGAMPGELWDVVAGTGVGKTLFARQIAARTCRDGWHTLYASGEMFAQHLVSKRVFPDANVSPIKYRFPEKITNEERAALMQAASEQCQECQIIDGELSLSRIRVAARRMRKKTKLGLVVGDYDQLIDAPGKTPLDRQINLTRGMKTIAMENECPAIMISQLRKLIEAGKSPTLDDLYGSKMASAHPTVVVYVHRDYVERLKGDETTAEIVIMKFRDGRVNRIPAAFNVKTLKFEDVPQGYEPPKKESKKRSADRDRTQSSLVEE